MNRKPQTIVFTVVVILTAIAIYVSLNAPCKFFSYFTLRDVPARCLSYILNNTK